MTIKQFMKQPRYKKPQYMKIPSQSRAELKRLQLFSPEGVPIGTKAISDIQAALQSQAKAATQNESDNGAMLRQALHKRAYFSPVGSMMR